MKNYCWGTQSHTDKPIHTVLFVSRNKDNAHIPNFEERRHSFITDKTPEELMDMFWAFADMGIHGETSRMYYSVNARDPKKIHKELLHFLIDEPDFFLGSIDSKIAGIAATKECSAESKWLFDFDINSKDAVREFVQDIAEIDPSVNAEIHDTPNGYAVVVDHGFDTRKLFEKWTKDVTLMRDDLLCVAWVYGGEKEREWE